MCSVRVRVGQGQDGSERDVIVKHRQSVDLVSDEVKFVSVVANMADTHVNNRTNTFKMADTHV